MDHKKSVLLAMTLVAAIITADEARQGRVPKPRNYVGLVAVWLVLSVLGERYPRLASPFAWLILFAVVVARGPEFFRFSQRYLGKPPKGPERLPFFTETGGYTGPVDPKDTGPTPKGKAGQVYTSGSPGINAMVRLAKQRFPDARVVSLYRTCSIIRGSGGYSDHGWGRAVDITRGSRAKDIAMRHWFEARKAQFNIAYSLGPDNEPRDHHDHVHISENHPNRGQRPPGC